MNTTQFPIKPKDFASWADYYWTYQYLLARHFYVPLLNEWGISLAGKRVLDVGCGDGGFTAGLASAGAICIGVDIKPFPWRMSPNVTYQVADVTHPNVRESIGDNFDLTILRDVIEHIPIAVKPRFVQSILSLAKSDAHMCITFPPYFSPYGLHQQAIFKSILRKAPYLSWLPKQGVRVLASLCHEDPQSVVQANEIADCRMPIYQFKRLIRAVNLVATHERIYFVRPSHEIRYGMKTRISPFTPIPILNEILASGCVYVLQRQTLVKD